LTRPSRLTLVLALLAFACGALSIACLGLAAGRSADHHRLECYRSFAEEDLVADSKCERAP